MSTLLFILELVNDVLEEQGSLSQLARARAPSYDAATPLLGHLLTVLYTKDRSVHFCKEGGMLRKSVYYSNL